MPRPKCCCLHQLLLTLTVVSGLLTGCQQEDGIRQYAVKRIPSPEQQTQKVSSEAAVRPQTWFFKLEGPQAAVAEVQPGFRAFIDTVTFDAAGTPRYPLPDGWTSIGKSEMRHDTLRIAGTDPPLEVAVSSLPTPPGDLTDYQLMNVNRWRRMIGLAELTSPDWLAAGQKSGELLSIPGNGQRPEVLIVDLAGRSQTIEQARMLAAMITPAPASSPPAQVQNPPAEVPPDVANSRRPAPFESQIPEGWSEKPPTSFRLASLEGKSDAGVVDISVTRIAGGGSLLENVNRWRQQVALGPLAEEGLGEFVAEVTVGGKPAKLVVARGEAQGILAAMVPDGETPWFFKMQGPVAAVDAERKHFEEYLSSVKFPGP